MMVRQVHRKTKSYLLTLDVAEARRINKKIDEMQVLGIDRVVVAKNPEFDELIKELRSYFISLPHGACTREQ